MACTKISLFTIGYIFIQDSALYSIILIRNQFYFNDEFINITKMNKNWYIIHS